MRCTGSGQIDASRRSAAWKTTWSAKYPACERVCTELSQCAVVDWIRRRKNDAAGLCGSSLISVVEARNQMKSASGAMAYTTPRPKGTPRSPTMGALSGRRTDRAAAALAG